MIYDNNTLIEYLDALNKLQDLSMIPDLTHEQKKEQENLYKKIQSYNDLFIKAVVDHEN